MGSLSGYVSDPSGAALVRAKVRLKRAPTAWAKETISDGQGHYEFRDVAPGIYRINVQAAGFADLSKKTAVFANRAINADLRVRIFRKRPALFGMWKVR
jgi:hypothetical protein